ncbi:MAG: hypothetical protein IKC11_05765 [Clostridia bacterium]|nr:hypothetical protein [Clostridia bacterium]
MESTKQFYDNLIMFYESAPASEHTLALIIKNLKECQKREEHLNSKIEANARAEECLLSQFNFARADAEYYKTELKRTEDQLRSVNFSSRRSERIDAINAGLKKECREKKHHVEFLLKKIHDEQNQIADLEAKLAESEDKCNKQWLQIQADTEHIQRLEQQLAELEVKNDKLGTELCNADNIVSYLQQQLAEKEQKIEKLQHYNDRLAQGIYHSYGEHFILKINQDKISFAVEQLKCILNITESIFEKALKQSSINQSFYDEILNCIDNQIKSFRGGEKHSCNQRTKKK